jgi:glyoxylate reductase
MIIPLGSGKRKKDAAMPTPRKKPAGEPALPLVVFTAPLPGGPESLLEGVARVKVLRPRGVRSEGDLIRYLSPAAGAVTLLSDPMTAGVLGACPQIRVVANYAVGYNNVDLKAAAAMGIAVTNTPDVLTEATADTTWALVLAAARRVVQGDRMMRAGRFKGWAPSLLLGMDLHGKTLGIVGMGRIGRAVARRAAGFGMRMAYYDSRRLPDSSEAALGARYLPLDEVVATSDVLSLHCPLTPETRHLLDARRLSTMKAGTILINTARGPIIDEAALVEALRSGPLAAAGLDVYENEPAMEPGLRDLANVVLLPHIASAGRETREAMASLAVLNVREVLAGRPPLTPVPVPRA